MIIDLRFGSKIDRRITTYFDKISYENRNKFNKFIGSFSITLNNNLDWWAENPASRNTYSSPLFHYFCSLILIQSLPQQKLHTFNTILVDSKVMKKLLTKLCKKRNVKEIKILYKPGIRIELKRLFKSLFYYEREFLKRLVRLVIIRLTVIPPNSNFFSNSITLVDTFMMKNHLTDDRWYGNFWKELDSNLRDQVFFVPTIVNSPISAFRLMSKSMRNDERNFVFKEDFLKFSDLVFSYFHKSRVKRIALSSYVLYEMELKALIEEDIANNRDVSTIFDALLNYRFIFRLSEAGIKLRLSIDWFEGHSQDKLWNLAVKNFFPNVKRIGYETYRSFPFYLSTFPIESERQAETIPDIFAVQGPSCEQMIKEFLPNQEVIVIPAFKYQHVWEHSFPEQSNDNIILVALPMSIEASVRIIELLIDAFNSEKFKVKNPTKVLIKSHPVNKISSIEQLIIKPFPKFFSFSNEKSFPKLLKGSSILITEASSTCLESLAYGIPVIIIENPTGLTYDPVPKDISEDLVLKCKIYEDLTKAIMNFLSLSQGKKRENQQIGKQIRENYFAKVSKQGIDRFLDIK